MDGEIIDVSVDGTFPLTNILGIGLPEGNYCVIGVSYLLAEGIDTDFDTPDEITNAAGTTIMGGACIDLADCSFFTIIPPTNLINVTQCIDASTYSVTLTLSGAAGTYNLSGTAVTGANATTLDAGAMTVFTLNTAQPTYTITATPQDPNGCPSIEYTIASLDCGCPIEAGFVMPDVDITCQAAGLSGSTSSVNAGGGNPADYEFQFLLTDGIGETILDMNNSGTFDLMDDAGNSLDPGMYCIIGVYYEIAEGLDASAGTVSGIVNDAGLTEAAGACISFTPCVPLEVLPSPDTPDDQAICYDPAVGMFNLSETYPDIDHWYLDSLLTDEVLALPFEVAIGTYYGTVDGANGCESLPGTFVINDDAPATFNITTAGCDNDGNYLFEVILFSGSGGDMTLSGNAVPATTTLASGDTLFTTLSDIQANYTLVVTDPAIGACTLPITLMTPPCSCIELEAAPEAICVGSDILLEDILESNSPDGDWYMTTQPVGVSPALIQNDSLITDVLTDTGVYIFGFVPDVAVGGVCPDTTYWTVLIDQSLTSGTANPMVTVVCSNDAIVIDLAGMVVGADPGGTWVDLSDNPATGTAFNSATATFDPTDQAGGMYDFAYVQPGTGLCPVDTAVVQVQVEAFPQVVLLAPETACNNIPASSQVNLTALIDAGGMDGTWFDMLASGAVEVSANPLIYDFENVAAGSYEFSYTLTAPVAVCVDQVLSLQVVVEECQLCFPPEEPIIDADLIVTCDAAMNTNSFMAAVTDSTNIAWFASPTDTMPIAIGASWIPGSAGTFYAQAFSTQVDDCGSGFVPVTLMEDPIWVMAPQDTTITAGDAILLIASSSVDDQNGTFTWSTSDGVDGVGIGTVVNPTVTTLYTITLQTEDGCTQTDQVLVSVIPGPFIEVPTGFSPNGDGNNDFLRPLFEGVEVQSFQVFNRWGQSVHQGGTEGWDGIWNGQVQNMGVYVWFVQYTIIGGDGVVLEKKGNTTLVR